MFPSFSAPGLLSDLSADVASIGLDLPDGGYDKLHRLIESKGVLPTSKSGRMTLVAVMLLASRLVKQRLGPLGPIASFIHEIKDDGIREIAKRILESIHGPRLSHTPVGEHALWEMPEAERDLLFSAYSALDEESQDRLRAHMMRSTATRLAMIARLTPDQLRLVLELLSPHHPSTTHKNTSVVGGTIAAVNDFLFPWMRPRNRTGVHS